MRHWARHEGRGTALRLPQGAESGLGLGRAVLGLHALPYSAHRNLKAIKAPELEGFNLTIDEGLVGMDPQTLMIRMGPEGYDERKGGTKPKAGMW